MWNQLEKEGEIEKRKKKSHARVRRLLFDYNISLIVRCIMFVTGLKRFITCITDLKYAKSIVFFSLFLHFHEMIFSLHNLQTVQIEIQ